MATKKRTRKAKAKSASNNGESHKGALGSLFGSSVCRVMMTAGRAGATYEQAVAVLGKHRIKAKESTVRQNLRIGAAGKMVGAELTKEQLSEFGV